MKIGMLRKTVIFMLAGIFLIHMPMRVCAESDGMVAVSVRELTREEYENEVMRMEESGNVYHSKEKSEYGNRAAELSGTVRSQFNATSKTLKFLVKTRHGEIANEIGINTLNIQYNPGNNWVSLPGIHRYKTNSEQYYLEYEVSNISKGTQVKATCTHYAIKDGITARKYSSIDPFTAQ